MKEFSEIATIATKIFLAAQNVRNEEEITEREFRALIDEL